MANCPHCSSPAQHRPDVRTDAFECPTFGCPGKQGFFAGEVGSAQLLEQARIHLLKNAPDRAFPLLTQVIDAIENLPQKSVQDAKHLAEAYARRGQIRLLPDQGEAQVQDFTLAHQEYEVLAFRGAPETLAQAINLVSLGLALQSLGGLTTALSRYSQAITLFESLNIPLAPGESQGLLDPLSEWAGATLLRGKLLMALARYQEALEDLDKADQLYSYQPSDPLSHLAQARCGTWLSRASALTALGYFEEALQDYAQSVRHIQMVSELQKTGPTETLAQIHQEMGAVYQKLNRPFDALFSYSEAVRVYETISMTRPPQDPFAVARSYANRAKGYLDMNDFDTAFRDYSQALNWCTRCAYHPDIEDFTAALYLNRGWLQKQRHQIEFAYDDYTQCIDIRKALRLDGQLPDLTRITNPLINRANLLKAQHRYPEALADYTQAIQLLDLEVTLRQATGYIPALIKALGLRSDALLASGDMDAARADVLKAQTLANES